MPRLSYPQRQPCRKFASAVAFHAQPKRRQYVAQVRAFGSLSKFVAAGRTPPLETSLPSASHMPLTTRISLARSQAAGRVAAQEMPFAKRFSCFLVPSAAIWILLLGARWRYSDEERMANLEDQPGGAIFLDFLSWRIVQHMGPYQLPNFVAARVYERPLATLCKPLLLDGERSQALSRLEAITHRRLAASALAPHGVPLRSGTALQVLEPVLLSLLAPASSGAQASASHQASSLRILLDVLISLEPEARKVPDWVLTSLVTATGEPWDSGAQGQEVRATVLLLLLQCPENSRAAADLPEVCVFLSRPGSKIKEDTFWPLKAYLLSGETPDLLRRGARLVNLQLPGSVERPPRHARDTPSLQMKHDLRNFWTTALLTTAWASFGQWQGAATLQAAMAMGQASAVSVGLIAGLESLWRAEEHAIQAEWYWEGGAAMFACSAGMCLLNCSALAFAFRYSILVPFAFCRFIKDDLMDAYRWYDG